MEKIKDGRGPGQLNSSLTLGLACLLDYTTAQLSGWGVGGLGQLDYPKENIQSSKIMRHRGSDSLTQ